MIKYNKNKETNKQKRNSAVAPRQCQHVVLFLCRLKALIIICYGQNALLNQCSVSSDDERNVTTSSPWRAATVQMTCCCALNGPLVLQWLVAMVTGVSRHFHPEKLVHLQCSLFSDSLLFIMESCSFILASKRMWRCSLHVCVHICACVCALQTDYYYQYTECDSMGSRWRVAIPLSPGSCLDLPPPTRGTDCCEYGQCVCFCVCLHVSV